MIYKSCLGCSTHAWSFYFFRAPAQTSVCPFWNHPLEKNLNFQGAYRKYSSFFQEGWSTTWPAPFREDPFSPKRDPPGKRNSPSPIFSDFLHSPSSPLPVLPSALGAFTSLEHNLPPSLKNLIFLGKLPKKVKFFFKRVVSNHDNTLCLWRESLASTLCLREMGGRFFFLEINTMTPQGPPRMQIQKCIQVPLKLIRNSIAKCPPKSATRAIFFENSFSVWNQKNLLKRFYWMPRAGRAEICSTHFETKTYYKMKSYKNASGKKIRTF